MEEKVLKVLALAMKLKRGKGLDINVEFSPHINGFYVFQWNKNKKDWAFRYDIYLDESKAIKELNKVIKKLESL